MAKETIDTLKSAELNAGKLVNDAKAQAAKIVQDAESDSNKSIDEFERSMALKAVKILEDANFKANLVSKDILEKTSQEVAALESAFNEKSEEISVVLLSVIAG